MGTYIKARREALNVSQTDLAAAVGTSRSYLAQIEGGRVAMPNAGLRRDIARELGVSHLDLLVAAGELTREEAGLGATPPAEDPAVEAICALLRRVPIPPLALESFRDQLRAYERAARAAAARQPVGTGAP